MSLPREEPLRFGSPSLGEEEIAEVVSTLRSGWLTTGPRVARFEELFAGYVGTRRGRRGGLVHRSAAPLARGLRGGAGRRGDHHAHHVLRHRARDRSRRGPAGVRRRRSATRGTSTPMRSRPPWARARRRSCPSISRAGRAAWTGSRTSPAGTGCTSSRTRRTRRGPPGADAVRGRWEARAASASTPPRRSPPARAGWSRPTTRSWRGRSGCMPTTACRSARGTGTTAGGTAISRPWSRGSSAT